jgi:hypothetical protein
VIRADHNAGANLVHGMVPQGSDRSAFCYSVRDRRRRRRVTRCLIDNTASRVKPGSKQQPHPTRWRELLRAEARTLLSPSLSPPPVPRARRFL